MMTNILTSYKRLALEIITIDIVLQFDAAMQRYIAMKVSGFEYFKPSGKNVLYGLAFMVIPMVGFGYLVQKTRNDQEARIRRGEVAYKDRNFKFI